MARETLHDFLQPQGVTVSENGDLFVADSANHRVRKITSGGVVTTLAGDGQGFSDGQGAAAKFNSPRDVVVTKDDWVVVADCDNNCIRSITPEGMVTTLAGGDTGGGNATFNCPSGVAIDNDGNVIVADTSNHRICRVTPAGQVSTFAGNGAQGFSDGDGNAAQFNLPTSVAVDRDGSLIAADQGNHCIR